MLVLPYPDPVEFKVRSVKPNQLSSPAHAPEQIRTTQSNLGQYLYPIKNKDGKYVIQKVPAEILNKWCEANKAEWIDRPGREAYFLYELFRKYHVAPPEINPAFKNKPLIFPRSYKYEIDCNKVKGLMQLEANLAEELYLEQHPEIKSPDCICTKPAEDAEEVCPEDIGRWQSHPRIFAKSKTDPCIRRVEFAKFKKSFKNEACNFYYTNYPAPAIPFNPKKFS